MLKSGRARNVGTAIRAAGGPAQLDDFRLSARALVVVAPEAHRIGDFR
jgi:hypothetical protein